MTAVDGTITVRSMRAERRVDLRNGNWGTTSTISNGVAIVSERDTRRGEVLVLIDTAMWRHDVANWRWSKEAGNPADRPDWVQPDFDVSGWAPTPHLHAIHDVRFDGAARFRHRFELPAIVEGEPLRFMLGGRDDEDWETYSVWINGEPVAQYAGRQSHGPTFEVSPDSSDYTHLVFGGDNVLAVRCHGLDRPAAKVPTAEQEHLFFQGWLLDQCIVAGRSPVTRVLDFAVTDCSQSAPDAATVTAMSSETGLEAMIAYTATDDLLTKQVTITNRSTSDVVVLDVLVDSVVNHALSFSGGGRGQAVFAQSAFGGLEHPAGVSLVQRNDTVEFWQWPGTRLRPAESYASARAVLCGTNDEQPAERFARYVWKLRDRRTKRLTMYSPLGWYDFTNPADQRPELTEQLVLDNLEQLSELQQDGVHFEVYMFDDWWEPSNLAHFRHRTFPDGHARAVRAVRELGMKVGLWVAPSRALWTARRLPGVEASLANDMTSESVTYDSGAGWSWDDEFAGLFLREERFCLASEPFGSHFMSALVELGADIELDVLKLDGVITHCTSSRHDHLGGRWSVEPCTNHLLRVVDAIRAVRPNLYVIWYWAARSPWFLAHGDMIFDKGLKMEAATPSSTPALVVRDSGNLNIDQAISTVPHIPLALQDSLGVWIGDVAWCNYMGRAGWRDAFVLDEARGSAAVQMWGDLGLLDAEDRCFLAAELDSISAGAADFLTTEPIGPVPWCAEPYGYRRSHGANRSTSTVFNPSFATRDFGDVTLGKFEVRRIHDGDMGPKARYARDGRPGSPIRRPICVTSDSPGSDHADWTGTDKITLPPVDDGDVLAVVVRLERHGVWFYQPDLSDLLDVSLRVAGREDEPFAPAVLERTPPVRSRNGPGAPWMVWHVAAGTGWSGRPVEIDVAGRLPIDVVPHVEMLLLPSQSG